MTETYPPHIQKLIDDVDAAHEAKSGAERLGCWFSLSRASFAVLPRVLMEAMPDEWQLRMAKLLEEADEAFPNMPVTKFTVTAKTNGGKFGKIPDWLCNYRHPDRERIEECRKRV